MRIVLSAATTTLALGLALAVVVARHGASAAVLNFTLVESDPRSFTTIQQEILGFHMAMFDAQNHLDGLFPDHDVQFVDRTVVHSEANNPDMVKQVVLGLEEDNAVAFMGGFGDGGFVVHSILSFDGMPQASLSPVKHLPTATAIRDFGATPDLRALGKGVARVLSDNGLTAVTLINTPRDNSLLSALFYELELPSSGVRVHEKVLMGEGEEEAVADHLLASNIRSFLIVGSWSEIASLLAAAETRNMTQEGFVWMVPHTAPLHPFVTAPYSFYFTEFTRLMAQAKVLGPSLPDLDTTAPNIVALMERAQALPAIPSVPDYNITRDGITAFCASAYDTAMAMLRAVNRTIAAGGSPYDREAVIAEMYNTDYDGLQGPLAYTTEGGYGGLINQVYFRQYFDPVTGAGASFADIVEYNALTDDMVYSAVRWNTPDGQPPPNFSPESCGALFARIADGTCVPCGPGMRNDPTDGVEVCAFCDDGAELQGEACVPCAADEESVRLGSGEPVCKAKPGSSTDWAMVGGIVVGSVAGTVLLLALAALAYRKMERTRTEIAEHRAKAKQAQFLGFSFHEMRNPLNVVSSALEFAATTIKQLADEEGGNNKKGLGPVLKDLQCGQQSLVDTVHVLDTINMLSQIIHGVVAAEMQPTCPKELAREVIVMARQVRSSMLVNDGGGKDHEDAASEEGGEGEGDGNGGDKSSRVPDVVLDAVVKLDNTEIKSREFFVAMDRQKMRQALLILLINALKYTSKGRIAVEILMKRQKSHGAQGNSQHGDGTAEPVVVHMCVRDTGSGMPPEDIEHIFDLDYQTERGSVRSTGLGLVLAHRIVGMHGGEMEVRSVHSSNAAAQGLETGTRFTWSMRSYLIHSTSGLFPRRGNSGANAKSLPSNGANGDGGPGTELDEISQAEKAAQQPQPVANPGGAQPVALFGRELSSLKEKPAPMGKEGSNTTLHSGGNLAEMARTMPTKLRVLLMEDVKLNRTFMKRKLAAFPFNELGWVVKEVETGEQCLDLIVDQGEQFDVVFCDQILSNAGGKLLGNEVAKKLREHEEMTNAENRMVLIACSGNASDEDRKLYAESGMDGVVAKPLPSQKVLFKFLHPLLVHEV